MQPKPTKPEPASASTNELDRPELVVAGILSPVSERGHEHIATSIHLDSSSSETGILEEAVKIKPRLPLTLEEGIAGAAMIVLALITLANVIARYVLHASFAFTEEYSSVLLFGMVFVTASLATAKNSHIRMTFFTDRMSPRNQKLSANFGYVAIIVCFCVVIWYGSLMCWDAYKFGESSPGLGHPMWLYLIWLPLLSLLAVCRAVGVLIRLRAVPTP